MLKVTPYNGIFPVCRMASQCEVNLFPSVHESCRTFSHVESIISSSQMHSLARMREGREERGDRRGERREERGDRRGERREERREEGGEERREERGEERKEERGDRRGGRGEEIQRSSGTPHLMCHKLQ
jgi:hypothetical protein